MWIIYIVFIHVLCNRILALSMTAGKFCMFLLCILEIFQCCLYYLYNFNTGK